MSSRYARDQLIEVEQALRAAGYRPTRWIGRDDPPRIRMLKREWLKWKRLVNERAPDGDVQHQTIIR